MLKGRPAVNEVELSCQVMIERKSDVLSWSSLVLRASRSTGGPSSSMGSSWTCLCGWLAPLKSPPALPIEERSENGRDICAIAGRRTVVEREELPACLLGCDEEEVCLYEVRRKEW